MSSKNRTLSLFKANVGSFPGGVSVPAEAIDAASVKLDGFRSQGLIDDFRVFACGDNLMVLASHSYGPGAKKISDILWLVFETCADLGLRMHMHGVGEDIFPDGSAADDERPGPDSVELTFAERDCEPVVLLVTDRTRYGAMNLPLLRLFADPMTTRSLSAVKAMAAGFSFEVMDLATGGIREFRVPADLFPISRLLSAPERFAITRIWHTDSRDRIPGGEVVAATSARYKGTASPTLRSDVMMLVRAEGAMPTVGEVVFPFSSCPVVPGWRDNTPWGPLVPLPSGVSANNFLEGPPKVNALGIHVAGGRIHGPVDLFSGPVWEEAARRGYSTAHALSGAFMGSRETGISSDKPLRSGSFGANRAESQHGNPSSRFADGFGD